MTSFVPRYYEIEQALRTRIAELAPHSTLPSDAGLCEEFGVSRMTARGAVQRLVQEGLVYRVPGRGTFVADAPAHRSAAHILSFSDEMRRRGRVPSSRAVEKHTRDASDEERERLGVDRVVVLRRVRIADDEPIALETAVFSAERVEPLADERDVRRRGEQRALRILGDRLDVAARLDVHDPVRPVAGDEHAALGR